MIEVRLAYPTRPPGQPQGRAPTLWVWRRGGTLMMVMGLAYPARPRGSHEGVPLRLRRPPLSFGHFPYEWGQPGWRRGGNLIVRG